MLENWGNKLKMEINDLRSIGKKMKIERRMNKEIKK